MDDAKAEAEPNKGPKSKSVDEGSHTHVEEHEKESTSPTEQHFSPLRWDADISMVTSRKERVEAPTHTDGDKASRRLSGRLAQPKGTLEYAVSGSESLASIAAKFDTTTSELKKLNKLMTQMIWPGQKLFVPDKDYIPSTPSSPAASPVSTPREQKPLSFDIPLVKQTETTRGPGLAKAVESPTDPTTEAPKRHLSEEEAEKLDKECTERFIKVSVKHITDGQGVVNGVLLVTPNAVMFDPNVSDPLVLEHGANTYGLIAPMETIRAVAMYHDIAAMKLKTVPRTSSEGGSTRPAVYHAENCPMSKQPNIVLETDQPDSDIEAPDLIKDIPSGRTRQASVCSCGADSLLDSSSVHSTSSQDPALASTSPAKAFQAKSLSSSKLAQMTIPEENEVKTALSNGEKTQTTDATASNLKLLGIEMTELSLSKDTSDIKDRDIGEENVDIKPQQEANSVNVKNLSLSSALGEGEVSHGNTGPGPDGSHSTPPRDEDTPLQSSQSKSDDLDAKDGQTESVPIPTTTESKPHVTNAMSLSEKPELFKDLNDLIPKPAVHYEDPPLYLCLRLGRLEKPQSTTCPIEAYNKKRPKPEYWFSIPKDKVDPLYAFFIQWSPELYGEEDEVVDPSSRGFVVIEDGDIPEELEVVDDYFDQRSANKGRRISLSKGWEVVSSDEVKRRQLEEIPVVPELLSPSAILQEEHTLKISEVLPPRAEGYAWSLTYCTATDGFSLKTLYRNNQKVDSPALLVVLDTQGQVFGAMLSCGPKLSDHFYGSGETYLFTFCPEFKHFKWTGNNNFFIKGNSESLAVGSGEGSFGLWLDSDLYHGRTQHCETFNNDILSITEDFVVKAVETWTFV